MDPIRYKPAFHARETETIDALIAEFPELQESFKMFIPGEVVLHEGQENNELLVVVSGEARLCKAGPGGLEIEVDAFGPGSIVGLTSFWSREPVFARVEAITEVKCIAIELAVFESLAEGRKGFSRKIEALFVSNLSERYRHMVLAQVESANLSRLLEGERNHLRDTLAKLEGMTRRLVNQEKLATMGQLLAGIAHEINNPVGALLGGVESAREALEAIYQDSDSEATIVLKEGLACPFWSPAELRLKMASLGEEFPDVKRSLIRRIAHLTESAHVACSEVGFETKAGARLLAIFEVGACWRSMHLSTERIERIVGSLKNYGRATQSTWSRARLTDGIKDTLTVLNNRLERYDLCLELKEITPISCNVGEMNQVWTNLIVNAMDASSERDKIAIFAREDEEMVEVRVEDSGPGVPMERRSTVFEPNYTTKNQSGSFGLGLGLSISKDIIEKHGGTILIAESDLGGAAFVVRLPKSTE